MSQDPRIEVAARAIFLAHPMSVKGMVDACWDLYEKEAAAAVAAIDKAATIDPRVESFINARPEYIESLKNTRGSDDQSDYLRWQGHAESRRQLAQSLGYTVPHELGDKTERGTE